MLLMTLTTFSRVCGYSCASPLGWIADGVILNILDFGF